MAGLLLATGCSLSTGQQQSTTFAGGGNKRAELSCPRESSERVDVGSWRGTGRPDVARVFVRGTEAQKSVLSCREVDLNGDGRKDMLVYYLPDGRKLREEFDHDYDGVADVKSYYEAGQLVRQELDVNYDGKPDLRQHFEGGRIARTERLWESKEPSEPSASKADGGPAAKAEPATDSKSDPIGPATPAKPSEPTEATNPPPLHPADSTPRSITPVLPAPKAVQDGPSSSPTAR